MNERKSRGLGPFLTRREVLIFTAGAASATGLWGIDRALSYVASLKERVKLQEATIAERDSLLTQVAGTAVADITLAQSDTRAAQATAVSAHALASEASTKAAQADLAASTTIQAQEKSLNQITTNYLDKYAGTAIVGNKFLDTIIPREGKVDIYNFNIPQQAVLNRLRRDAEDLLKDGISLENAWNATQGKAPNAAFDQDYRLKIDGYTFNINEPRYGTDFHLAINYLRLKMALRRTQDPQSRNLLEEDVEDLKKLIEKKPQIEVNQYMWVIMPSDTALMLARIHRFMGEKGFPIMQQLVLGPKDEGPTRSIKEGISSGVYYNDAHRPPNTKGLEGQSSYSVKDYIYTIPHEEAHQMFLFGRSSEQTRIGEPERIADGSHQLKYEQMLARVFVDVLMSARSSGRKHINGEDYLTTFITQYSSSNSNEDAADTFEAYFDEGPRFRKFVDDIVSTLPHLKNLVVAKYVYMRDQISQGEELSYLGRRKRPEIAKWEQTVEERFYTRFPWNSVEGRRLEIKKILTDNNNWMQTVPGFENVKGRTEISNLDIETQLGMQDPEVWKYTTGVTPIGISLPYTIPHYEIEGQFSFQYKMEDGTTKKLSVNTEEVNIEQLIADLPQIKDARKIDYPRTTNQVTQPLAVTKNYPKFDPFGWQRDELNTIEEPKTFSVHFQFDPITKKWVTKPVETWLFKVTSNVPNPEPNDNKLESRYYVPLLLGEKDVFITFNDRGQIHRLKYFVPEKEAQ